MITRPEAMFLPAADGGQRLALHHHPDRSPARGAVLYLHPFAEEMNKVRRMASLQSRTLADAGYAVLQIDMLGCGDSSGELADVRWQDWVDDALEGARWLAQRHPDSPLWLWGARAGCLVAAEAAGALTPTPGLLLWAPSLNGRAQLQQFLRIKLAGEMIDGQAKGGLAALKQTLEAGDTVDIAGYALTATLARGLGEARLLPPRQAGRIAWLDVSSSTDATLSPAATQWLQACRDAGHQVHSALVPGPAFWQTSEVEEAPALLQATLAAIEALQS